MHATDLDPELEPRWDLSRLYQGPEDPAIDEDLRLARQRVGSLAAFYKGKIPELSAAMVRRLIDELDGLNGSLNKLFAYAYLLFSANTQDEEAKNLYAKIQREVPEVQGEAQFFQLEVQKLDEGTYQALLAAPELAEYRDHFGRIRRGSAHALDEQAERIIALKDSVGMQAWTQLYFETTADFQLNLGLEAYPDAMTLSQVHSLRESSDRAVREAAYVEALRVHGQSSRVLASVFNALFENHRLMMELRGHAHPFGPLTVEEALSPGVIEGLVDTVERHYHLVHRYFRLKAQILGLPDFSSHDIRAQYPAASSFIPYEEGQAIVVDALSAFHPTLGEMARGFFTERYVDPLSRPGKRAGAYCLSSGPTFHPYLFFNYNYTLKDVITMAHEMGHGTHNVIGGQHQSLTNCDRVTLFMETPSTFAETLTYRRLLALEVNPTNRLILLGSQIESAMMKIFKSNALTRFQLNVYERRREGVLPVGVFNALWGDEFEKLYAPAVRPTEWDKWEWSTFHHTLNLPFYDYAYTFGQLLVYALMQRYDEEGPAFAEAYMKLLGAGTSITIEPLLALVGVDLSDPQFWAKGLAFVEGMLDEFEGMVADSPHLEAA